MKKEEKINLIDENQQQLNKKVDVTFSFLGKLDITCKVDPKITFDNLVQRFKQEALKTDKNYFNSINIISFLCNGRWISEANKDVSLNEIVKDVKDSIMIRVFAEGGCDHRWDISDNNNRNQIFNDNQIPVSNNEHQNSHSNWKRILFFAVGIFSLIAASDFFS